MPVPADAGLDPDKKRLRRKKM